MHDLLVPCVSSVRPQYNVCVLFSLFLNFTSFEKLLHWLDNTLHHLLGCIAVAGILWFREFFKSSTRLKWCTDVKAAGLSDQDCQLLCQSYSDLPTVAVE